MKVIRPLVAILSALFCATVYAGEGNGKVTFLLVNNDTTPVWVVFNVENVVSHACTTPNQNLGKFKFTIETDRGREMLSLLMSAEARGATVTAKGTGSCVEQNRESVKYISLGDPSI